VSSTHGDPDQARAHWQAYLQALHGAPVPAIRYYIGASSQALANALRQQWKMVLGVDVTLVPFIDTYLPPRNVELYPFGLAAEYPDPQDFLSNLWLPSAPNNLTHVNVLAANALMQQADTNSNTAQRAQQYAEAEQLLINQVAWCPLLQGVEHYQVRSYVHGWLLDAEGLPPNDIWTQTYITDHYAGHP
jgi:ABC-type oligopeptide transport system substrate-binding subunit